MIGIRLKLFVEPVVFSYFPYCSNSSIITYIKKGNTLFQHLMTDAEAALTLT